MIRNSLQKEHVGVALYDDKHRIVSRLNGSGSKTIAYIQFDNLRIDFGDIIDSVLNKPISYTRLYDLCWNRILDEINLVKNDPVYASVFTRIEIGSGHTTMKNRMSNILTFVYDFWYDSEIRKELEVDRYANSVRTRFNRRIDRQDYYS